MEKVVMKNEKIDRKTVERNRRIYMKSLCFQLTSLIPPHYFQPSKLFKDFPSQQDQLDQSTVYIKQLKERVEELKREKEVATSMASGGSKNIIEGRKMVINESGMPTIFELREVGSCLHLVLISGLKKKKLKLHQVINILEEEGAEVVSASFCIIGHKVFHTIHAKVIVCRLGVAIASVCQKIEELINS